MSDTDRGVGARSAPERPMLILGGDHRDVEETTPVAAAFQERLPALEGARERLLTGTEQSAPRGLTSVLGLGSAALVVAGVVLSRGRRETE